MNLSVSNIAWDEFHDEQIYSCMKKYGYTGLEIAPTRIITSEPYDKCNEIRDFATQMETTHKIKISSMQSIWFGRNEKLFSSEQEFQFLVDYTKKAIDFASAAKCENLVFGNPKSRIVNNQSDIKKAITFFEEIGEYALKRGTFVSLEANPTIYGTNFINTTEEAILFINSLKTKGIKLNFDLGTFIYNNEDLSSIEDHIDVINHIHISEPYLSVIEKRDIHKELSALLKSSNYENYISIEMKKYDEISLVENTIAYIAEVFG